MVFHNFHCLYVLLYRCVSSSPSCHACTITAACADGWVTNTHATHATHATATPDLQLSVCHPIGWTRLGGKPCGTPPFAARWLRFATHSLPFLSLIQGGHDAGQDERPNGLPRHLPAPSPESRSPRTQGGPKGHRGRRDDLRDIRVTVRGPSQRQQPNIQFS